MPAGQKIKDLVDRAYAALPAREGGWQVQIRSDSAAYEYEALDHWDKLGWSFLWKDGECGHESAVAGRD